MNALSEKRLINYWAHMLDESSQEAVSVSDMISFLNEEYQRQSIKLENPICTELSENAVKFWKTVCSLFCQIQNYSFANEAFLRELYRRIMSCNIFGEEWNSQADIKIVNDGIAYNGKITLSFAKPPASSVQIITKGKEPTVISIYNGILRPKNWYNIICTLTHEMLHQFIYDKYFDFAQTAMVKKILTFMANPTLCGDSSIEGIIAHGLNSKFLYFCNKVCSEYGLVLSIDNMGTLAGLLPIQRVGARYPQYLHFMELEELFRQNKELDELISQIY